MKTLLLVSAASAFAAPATAQLVVPVSQERSVRGFAIFSDKNGSTTDAASKQASDFARFQAAELASSGGDCALATGGGNQDSEFLCRSVVAAGSAFATAEAFDPCVGDSSGSSRLLFDFDLTAPSSYRLAGEISAFDFGGYAEIFLRDTAEIEAFSASGPAQTVPFDVTGQLPAGAYQLEVRAEASAFADSSCDDPDTFAEYNLNLEFTPESESYCMSAPNSVGPGAAISSTGSPSVAANDFGLSASGTIPSGFGIFFYGDAQVQAPFGDGFRCVAGNTFRLQPPLQADAGGVTARAIDFTTGPTSSGAGAITPGSTWNFQLWYRDPMGPGASGFNTSDGLSVYFCD